MARPRAAGHAPSQGWTRTGNCDSRGRCLAFGGVTAPDLRTVGRSDFFAFYPWWLRPTMTIMIEALKEKLGAEVERLQHELNVILPNEIRKAVELGDLRENSEYKAALERQQFVQARLGQLRQRLSKL